MSCVLRDVLCLSAVTLIVGWRKEQHVADENWVLVFWW